MSSSEGQTIEFVPLLNFEDDYEILNQYPFTIRKKSNHRVLSESLLNGYPRVSLNQKSYKKHILIAKQFITNDDPEHKTELDHISRDRSDYHLSNLRWVSPSENSKNRTKTKNNIQYEYVDDIPDDAIVVDEYNGHELTDYYFYDNVFYFFNGVQYRKLHINTEKKSGSLYVIMNDVDNKRVCVFINKFKRQYDLI